MPEYIERDEAIRTAITVCSPLTQFDAVDIAEAMENIPTADVVEVVRCKDCEHLKRNSLYAWCEPKSTIWDKYIVQPDNFCCLGKRKEVKDA